MKEGHVGTIKKSNRKYRLDWDTNADKFRREHKGVLIAPLVCTFPLFLRHTLWSHVCFMWHVERRQVGFLPSHSSIAQTTGGNFFTDRMSETRTQTHFPIRSSLKSLVENHQWSPTTSAEVKTVSTIIRIQHCPDKMYVNIHGCVFLTLVISTGRPDLEIVIIWSSPLACLRCCVAPVMSWNTSQRCSHQSQRKREKQAEATIEIQTCLGSHQELKGNTDPELTFICLERNAARIKACLLSNKKSSCCWAARVIVKEVLVLILCSVIYVHIGSMLFMHHMHHLCSTSCTHYYFDSWFQ